MAIYVPGDGDNEHIEQLLEDIENKCFLCGEDLLENSERSTGGAVFWAGSSGIIALHQPCAEHLGLNLIQDARTLVMETKQISKLSHLPPIDAYHWYTK